MVMKHVLLKHFFLVLNGLIVTIVHDCSKTQIKYYVVDIQILYALNYLLLRLNFNPIPEPLRLTETSAQFLYTS